jgi:hypothetical protein
MTIRFRYGGITYTADTPQEAAETTALLKKGEARTAHEQRASRMHLAAKEGRMEDLHDILTESPLTWTPSLFTRFIERLGKAQQYVLALLVVARHATDEELRACVNVPGNQALAGILSGISKQAAALDIPARDIFSFENHRKDGKRWSNYRVASKFADIASQVHWPGPDQFPHKIPAENN